MSHFKSLSHLVFASFLFLSACSEDRGIYSNLGPEEDGVISVIIPDEGAAQVPEQETDREVDELTQQELDLVDQWHEGEVDKLSFVVVDVENNSIVKSYFADKPQRLASVTKIPTGLAALETVRNVEVPKVSRMMKISNNGEASRYVRLVAKALDGLVIGKPHYTQKHSCPSAFLDDQPAAEVVMDWLVSELPNVDWTDASLNDGAGCHYDNFMTSIQVSKILQYADSLGEAYNGKSFEELLSINGKDGTWKNRNPEHKGAIFAKTGTLRPNANLSGYFYARYQGKFKKFYFSVFINKKGGGNYSTRARKLIEGLLRYWINYYSAYSGQPLEKF